MAIRGVIITLESDIAVETREYARSYECESGGVNGSKVAFHRVDVKDGSYGPLEEGLRDA